MWFADACRDYNLHNNLEQTNSYVVHRKNRGRGIVMRDTDEIKVKRWTWRYIFGTLILIAVIISCVVFIGYWLGWNLRIWVCKLCASPTALMGRLLRQSENLRANGADEGTFFIINLEF